VSSVVARVFADAGLASLNRFLFEVVFDADIWVSGKQSWFTRLRLH
jgi:hypothetical protein